MKQLAALELLLGAYLHEDWAEDYPDLWHAVDDFTDGEPQSAPHFRADVEQVLGQGQSEQEIQQSLRQLGIVYYPLGDGWDSYRAWLLAVAAHVEKNLHKSPAA
ncbi:contact-dependent growth inhibition system immunity protein [Jatrophihabitans sp.]|uniref:contact-dependent growth inhibition system immunity protein n=1 Tax=Jatrophihabitans sp. TaxID=1932789 RepID=UPI002EF9E95B